ncbi:MAG: hypothetical protein EXX96DRAFT_595632 [Benjaminiella poitrasii]|nr:MAG: hypothetical protein EXX96DRAFT_595632 [Benjaminiella poitrasii]
MSPSATVRTNWLRFSWSQISSASKVILTTLKSLLDLFGILWFIVGNYLIFSNSSCSETASLYYYTILAWIVFGYLILFVPLFACLSVIFCLPCVLVAMRLFNINISNVMKGGTKEEIAKIPVFKYKPPADTKPTMTEDAPSTAKTIITAPNVTIDNQSVLSASSNKKKKKISILRRLLRIKFNKKKRSENVASQKNLNYITILKADDAVCSICLGDYEEDELVCKLW